MILAQRAPARIAFPKLIGLLVLWIAIWLPLHSGPFDSFLERNFTASTAYVLSLVAQIAPLAVLLSAFVFLLARFERPASVRQLFKIEKLDVKGIWMTFGLGIALQLLNAAFLWKYVLQPARNFLLSLGVPGPAIGLGTGSDMPLLAPGQALFLAVFMLLFWWLEVPEELFFRGYLQNQLQGIVGRNAAMLLSALFWALAHAWGLANTLERLLYGLVYAFVFRVRQNTTGPMLVHPLSNRALVLGLVLPQILGVHLNPQGIGTWLFILALYVALLLAAIAGWRLLRLDR